ncbi:MAG: (d)CMP kinase [Cyclobacteriaceae bacterium]|nr:(d)CMP kinase [Cyclobacteriaceae bacterium]MCK5369333.1 (d)CMP kinase [Cyclobacteriaceae bacterium]
MKNIVIAIDGNSGCGKSSTAKVIARKLKYIYIDTGAMYRAVTLFFIKYQIDLKNASDVDSALKQIDISFEYNIETGKNETFLNGKNVENKIRQMEVSNMVSPVSEISMVRRKLVEQQRRLGKEKGVVMDGRDIGTVVFPDAELKIFMTAALEVRALRRQKELMEKNTEVELEEVIENLKSRDNIDSSRADSPLKKAQDAYEIDTSNLTFDEQVNQILDLIKDKVEVE